MQRREIIGKAVEGHAARHDGFELFEIDVRIGTRSD